MFAKLIPTFSFLLLCGQHSLASPLATSTESIYCSNLIRDHSESSSGGVKRRAESDEPILPRVRARKDNNDGLDWWWVFDSNEAGNEFVPSLKSLWNAKLTALKDSAEHRQVVYPISLNGMDCVDQAFMTLNEYQEKFPVDCQSNGRFLGVGHHDIGEANVKVYIAGQGYQLPTPHDIQKQEYFKKPLRLDQIVKFFKYTALNRPKIDPTTKTYVYDSQRNLVREAVSYFASSNIWNNSISLDMFENVRRYHELEQNLVFNEDGPQDGSQVILNPATRRIRPIRHFEFTLDQMAAIVHKEHNKFAMRVPIQNLSELFPILDLVPHKLPSNLFRLRLGFNSDPTAIQVLEKDQFRCIINIYIDVYLDMQVWHENSSLLQSNFPGFAKYLRDQHRQHLSLNQILSIADTVAVVPRTNLDQFQLKLRDYQEHTLQWMMERESVCNQESIPFTLYDLSLDSCPIIRFPRNPTHSSISQMPEYLLEQNSIFVRQNHFNHIVASSIQERNVGGGFLCDQVGSGKTVTTLALIHSHPFDENEVVFRDPLSDKVSKKLSRATLVISPVNLVDQWCKEAKRTLVSSSRIFCIKTITDYNRISWRDALEADIIIVSLSFFDNPKYIANLSQRLHGQSVKVNKNQRPLDREKKQASLMQTLYWSAIEYFDRENFLDEKGTLVFQWIQWWRIVYDEYHELVPKKNSLSSHVSNFIDMARATFIWGISGTPNLEPTAIFQSVEQLLHMNQVKAENSNAQLLFSRAARRNLPEMNLLPLKLEQKMVQLSPNEMELIHSLMEEDKNMKGTEKIMICNHHDLNQRDASSDKIATVDQVAENLQARRKTQIGDLQSTISNLRYQLDFWEMTVESRTLKQTQVDELARQLETVSSQYYFFENVLNGIKEKKNECSVCYEEMTSSTSCLTKCGHSLCLQCIKGLLRFSDEENVAKCPTCRARITMNDVMLVSKPSKTLDVGTFGSKIEAVANYITEVLNQNPDAKFILFIQFRRLSKIVATGLIKLQIPLVLLTGNVMQRDAAIRNFKRPDSNIRVIMLSSDDSCSGLNLIEASHVILFHPFLFEDGRDAAAAEAQGIARAYRSGQTKSVTVVRFIAAGTFEEEILKNRATYRVG